MYLPRLPGCGHVGAAPTRAQGCLLSKEAIGSSKNLRGLGGVDKTGSKDEKIQTVLPVTFGPEFKCAYLRQLEIAVVYNTKELIPCSQHWWPQLLMVLASRVIRAESFLRR